MDHADQPTCGKGLAANSVLPSALAALVDAQAQVLNRHIRALDPNDAAANAEIRAYTSLERGFKAAAEQLDAVSREMDSYRDLPVAPHDMAAMTDPRGQAQAFQLFVDRERDLLSLLTEKVTADEQLLG